MQTITQITSFITKEYGIRDYSSKGNISSFARFSLIQLKSALFIPQNQNEVKKSSNSNKVTELTHLKNTCNCTKNAQTRADGLRPPS